MNPFVYIGGVRIFDGVAFVFFGVAVRWYGILLTSGIIAGVLYAYFEAKRLGENPEDILDLALFCVPAAVIGARVYYVLFNLDYYKGDFLKMINIREGGMAIHGSLIAAFLVGFFVMKYKKKSFGLYADLVAPAVILGQAIGRWGNFANGEAHGGPTSLPWGILVDGVRVHPTFLYESLWNLGVFVFLIILSRRKKFTGQIILLYGILYSVGRFFIEGLRTDSLMVLGLRTAQLVSLLVIIAFGILYAYFDFKNSKRLKEEPVEIVKISDDEKTDENQKIED